MTSRTPVVIGMAVLQLPDLGQKMMPFAILLGGVFTFVRLSRSQELVAARAAGISAWDFLLPPLAVAVLIGVVAVTMFTPVSARMFARIRRAGSALHQGPGLAAFGVAKRPVAAPGR